MQIKLIFLVYLTLFISSCKKNDNLNDQIADQIMDSTALYVPVLPSQMFDYESSDFPQHFLDDPILSLILNFNPSNTITNEGAQLGRVLFYDRNLSANNTISCASCHHQDKGFSDGNAISQGFDGLFTSRNSMSFVNLDYQRGLFWDKRANGVETQALLPIQDLVEMGMDLNDLEEKLSQISYYPALFDLAFGDTAITSSRIGDALGQFMRSIRTYRSKYDEGVELNFANFTSLENQGRQLFFSGQIRCNNCHTGQNFGGVSDEINGLDIVYSDDGIGGVTGNVEDNGRFKSVSLRNIELTGPYMHDGRFESLEEVIDFYDQGIQPHTFLDDRLTPNFVTGGAPIQFNMTQNEKDALIAFLKTLTDWELVNDERFSNPFPW